jgi:membrane-associated protease RseP (regulator of RpoE activity)
MGKNVVLHQNVTLILPGINIPLFEGIIALGVILIVHEFAHGISAVAHRIKLQNTGLVLFGSLVVGAFVEVDEKKLFRSSKKEQLRVLSSGIGSNFIFSVIFGFLFILFLALTQQYTLQGCYVKAENIIILFDSTTPCIKAGPMSAIRVYTDPILNSIYNILGLLTVLNFTVATINILPLPFFDGDHILKATLGNGNLYNIIRAITIICFIILILPAFV